MQTYLILNSLFQTFQTRTVSIVFINQAPLFDYLFDSMHYLLANGILLSLINARL